MVKKKSLSVILAVIMALSIIPANIALPEAKASTSSRRVVGYLPSYRSYDAIDWSAMTHCILSFMTYSGGTLTSGFSDSAASDIASRCHTNGAKCMIAIGGWNGFDTSDGPFTTAEKRTSFINQVMSYVDRNNLDGVDLDLEVTDSEVWSNFDAFVSELSGRLKAEGKLLTMAVSSWFTDPIQNSTYNYFDFINLMTYDANMTGTGENAPWSQIYNMVSYYSQRGVSNEKMTIGVPFYGYGSGGTAYTYAQILAINYNSAKHADLYNGIYYNGEDTIRAKAEYSKSYGGTMIWEIGQDASGSDSLLAAIKEVMASGTEETTQATTTQAPTTQGATTTALPDGYVSAQANWNELDYWSVYFASGWAGDPTGCYKTGNSYNDFSTKIITASNSDWGVQMKTKSLSVEPGKKYICKASVQSNMAASQIRFKEDVSNTENMQTLQTGTNNLQIEFTAGDTAQIFFDLGKAPAGLEFTVTSFSIEKVEEEIQAPTTVQETTVQETTTKSTNITISDKISVEGFQISNTLEGIRTISSVEPQINGQNVTEYGNVYAISRGGVTETDMVVGSTNNYVAYYKATTQGIVDTNYSSSSTAVNYVRTILDNGSTSVAHQQNYMVRGYAKLADGTYVYSNVINYSVFNVAKILYEGGMMSTSVGHNYLYNNILKVVDVTYKEVDYDWANAVVKP